MGDFTIKGINSIDDVNRLVAKFQEYLSAGQDEFLFSEGYLEWNFDCEELEEFLPTVEELHELVDLYDDEYECFNLDHRLGCSCCWDAAHTEPRQGKFFEVSPNSGPVQFVPCTSRGTHSTLTECWMCFTDVEFNRMTAQEALRDPEASL